MMQHEQGQGEVTDPRSGDAVRDLIGSCPVAYREHQGAHPWVELSERVQHFGHVQSRPIGRVSTLTGVTFLPDLRSVFNIQFSTMGIHA